MTRIALKVHNGWKSRLLGVSVLVLIGLGIAANQWQQAQASFSWLTQAEAQYPTIVGTPLDNCNLCHTNAPALNTYGSDFATHSHSFTAIENLDSDGDRYSNLQEINAHTFPGDLNSHPITSPTATRTQMPPTATATNTRVPPTATATSTRVPPSATPSSTAKPATATSTATRVPPTATSVNLPPPATATLPATATSTRAVPTATNTVTAPTATSTRATSAGTKTPTKVPPATRPIAFRDAIRQLPGTKGQIGNWLVGNMTVHVTSQTKISRDDDDNIALGTMATVRGTVLSDGSVNAASIAVQEDDKGKRLRGWLRTLSHLLGLSRED